MNKIPKILLFYDLTGFCLGLHRLTPVKAFYDINFSPEKNYDAYYVWCVNYILKTYHGLNVVDGHPYHLDEFKTILSTNEAAVATFFRDSINLHHLDILRGQDVKTIVNGSDLIITRCISLNQLLIHN